MPLPVHLSRSQSGPSIFTEQELELLISGSPVINVADWRANTGYVGYEPHSPVIEGFWAVVSEFSQDDLVRLLQFATGSTRVPAEGFKALVRHRIISYTIPNWHVGGSVRAAAIYDIKARRG